MDMLPCYADRINTPAFNSKKEIKKFIEDNLLRWGDKYKYGTGIISISITERDYNYKLWLEVVQEFPGCTINTTLSKYHSNYSCYFINIPVTGESYVF